LGGLKVRDAEVWGRHCERALLFVMAAGPAHVEVDNAGETGPAGRGAV
jgi:hypothetical protein